MVAVAAVPFTDPLNLHTLRRILHTFIPSFHAMHVNSDNNNIINSTS